MLLVLLITPVNKPISALAKPTIGDQFIARVYAYKNVVTSGRGDWFSPPSPWTAYFSRQFSQGLSPTRKTEYLAYQKKGRCEALVRLEQIGFVNLYPELTQALSDKTVNDIFSHEIVPSHSFGARRCQAHGKINPIIKREQLLDAEYYYLTIPGTNLGNRLDEVHDFREIILRKAFTILFDLAACYDYKPAINDILEYYKLYLIFVGYDERYYFYARAKHYDLEASDVSTVMEELKKIELPNPYPQHDPAHEVYKRHSGLRSTAIA